MSAGVPINVCICHCQIKKYRDNLPRRIPLGLIAFLSPGTVFLLAVIAASSNTHSTFEPEPSIPRYVYKKHHKE